MVLVFPGAPRRPDIRLGVFPGTTPDTLFLQPVRVFLGSLVLQLRVEVVHGIHTGLGEDGTGPLGHIAGHVEEAVGVGGVNAHLTGDEVAVLGIVALVGLEIGIEASIAVFHALVLPWELGAVLSPGSVFPFRLGGQPIARCRSCGSR